MKYALISPDEQIYSNGAVIGTRIADVADVQFAVAAPLTWVQCDDTVVADQYYYSTNNQIVAVPAPPPPPKPKSNTGPTVV